MKRISKKKLIEDFKKQFKCVDEEEEEELQEFTIEKTETYYFKIKAKNKEEAQKLIDDENQHENFEIGIFDQTTYEVCD